MDLFSKKYELLETLGSGSFGEVRVARCRKTNERYACKIIKKSSGREAEVQEEMVLNELCALKQCKHPHIVCLHDEVETPDALYILMELVNGGEMLDDIISKGQYSEWDACALATQVFEAVRYLHEKNIAHRDLNPGNLLLHVDDAGKKVVKVADFGLSQFTSDHSGGKMYTLCGSPDYVAPEILKGEGYGLECDIWSLGVILYIMLCGYPPIYDDDQATQFDMIIRGDYDFPPEEWDLISPEAKDLVAGMLKVDPSERLTMSEVLAHVWCSEYGGSSPAHRDRRHDTDLRVSIRNLRDLQAYRKATVAPPPPDSSAPPRPRPRLRPRPLAKPGITTSAVPPAPPAHPPSTSLSSSATRPGEGPPKPQAPLPRHGPRPAGRPSGSRPRLPDRPVPLPTDKSSIYS
eukprot:Rmarinus@m.15498